MKNDLNKYMKSKRIIIMSLLVGIIFIAASCNIPSNENNSPDPVKSTSSDQSGSLPKVIKNDLIGFEMNYPSTWLNVTTDFSNASIIDLNNIKNIDGQEQLLAHVGIFLATEKQSLNDEVNSYINSFFGEPANAKVQEETINGKKAFIIEPYINDIDGSYFSDVFIEKEPDKIIRIHAESPDGGDRFLDGNFQKMYRSLKTYSL